MSQTKRVGVYFRPRHYYLYELVVKLAAENQMSVSEYIVYLIKQSTTQPAS